MPKYKPINTRDFLSKPKENWLRTNLSPGFCRCSAIAGIMTSTPRPTAKGQTMWDGYYKNEKLHDGEPGIIVAELEKRWPNFWDGYQFTLTDGSKKAFIGEWCRTYIRAGLRAYGKPNLRKWYE